MRPETILAYVRAVPFRPFRLVMNSGKVFEVRHPEFLKVGKDFVLFFYATSPDDPIDHWDTVSLLLIQTVEHIDGPPSKVAMS